MAEAGVPQAPSAAQHSLQRQQQQRSSGSTLSSHPPATTTISTIAVQSGATRIVVALLQVTKFKSFRYPSRHVAQHPAAASLHTCIHSSNLGRLLDITYQVDAGVKVIRLRVYRGAEIFLLLLHLVFQRRITFSGSCGGSPPPRGAPNPEIEIKINSNSNTRGGRGEC